MRTAISLGILVIVLCFTTLSFAQPGAVKTENDLKDLLKKSVDKDFDVSVAAQKELNAVPENSFPILLKFAHKEEACIALMAGKTIARKNPNYPQLTEAMGKIARGAAFNDTGSLQESMMCRRAATFQLATTTDGLKIILLMLKGDTWEKQSAIFALDDLTEESTLPSGGVEVVKEMIPLLGKLQDAKDATISVMSNEVLSQLTQSPIKELSEAAKKVYQP